ncbi:unnamed protein product [Effrenium voratum]|uniref:Transmembrane protein n=1 Tax=Effrenium voratum TaxID=2562239 RepID=A0AA36NAX7_9DINO|nr:unnamed protein product [Effrenium voratum]CAJ1426883.1 unnamed protein product [Effrenium voratum]
MLWGKEELGDLCGLVRRTSVAYVRMAATVIVAVVVRLCLDCLGLVLTGQDPQQASFWFAHCHKDGKCVLTGILLFFFSLGACCLFGWSCRDWILDVQRNPWARKFSFQVVLDAATWIPISVSVGKTNALVEWFMDTAKDNLVQTLRSSCLAALLTFSCALMTHLVMTNCRGVADPKGKGLGGFLRFFLLATITCLGWAVAWSNWELVLSLGAALDPAQDNLTAQAVIGGFFVLSTLFYLRFGPEPIIPDPQLQQLCYCHGYSNSVRRSFVSYMVYSCVVCLVMSCCDPTYGLLIMLASWVYSATSSMFDVEAFAVLCLVAVAVTLVSALTSACITWAFEVDALTSMRLSRSVNDACDQMVKRRRTEFGEMLLQVQKTGSDACFLEEGKGSPPHAAGGSARALEDGEAYTPMGEEALLEVESERQLQLNPGAISTTVCLSVLVYDVLGFVVCFQWGMLCVRGYSVLCGHLASRGTFWYMASCLVYSLAVIALTSRFVLIFFASEEEKRQAEEALAVSPARARTGFFRWRTRLRGGSEELCQELSQNLTAPEENFIE